MTFRVSLAVIQDARKLAFKAAGGNTVVKHSEADKQAGLPPTIKLDPRVQKAISYYAGCSHTPRPTRSRSTPDPSRTCPSTDWADTCGGTSSVPHPGKIKFFICRGCGLRTTQLQL